MKEARSSLDRARAIDGKNEMVKRLEEMLGTQSGS
jgi:hypothetical protein